MLSTVGATGTPGTLGIPGCRGPILLPVRTSAAFTIASHLLRWPGQVRRFPHPTRPALIHLFEPKFVPMSSRYSMFVRRYREGLTFCRAGERAGAGAAGVVAPGSAERAARLADAIGHMRQTRLFMLFRRNVSVCSRSSEALYFYRVPSPPAASDGSMGPLAGNLGTPRGVSEDAIPDADGELCATGVGVMSGVADAGTGPPAGEVQGDTEPIAVIIEPAPATADTTLDAVPSMAGTGVVPETRATGEPAGAGEADGGSDPAGGGPGPAETTPAQSGTGPADAADTAQEDGATAPSPGGESDAPAKLNGASRVAKPDQASRVAKPDQASRASKPDGATRASKPDGATRPAGQVRPGQARTGTPSRP